MQFSCEPLGALDENHISLYNICHHWLGFPSIFQEYWLQGLCHWHKVTPIRSFPFLGMNGMVGHTEMRPK